MFDLNLFLETQLAVIISKRSRKAIDHREEKEESDQKSFGINVLFFLWEKVVRKAKIRRDFPTMSIDEKMIDATGCLCFLPVKQIDWNIYI